MNAGDVVWLKSGGPAMTVEALIDDLACLVWFDEEDNLYHEAFVVTTLTTEQQDE